MSLEITHYLLVLNTPMNIGLFTKTNREQLDWDKYGLKFHSHWGAKVGRHETKMNADGEKLYHNIIPIIDMVKIEKFLPSLEKYCENTPRKDDEVRIITAEEAQACKDCMPSPVKEPIEDLT